MDHRSAELTMEDSHLWLSSKVCFSPILVTFIIHAEMQKCLSLYWSREVLSQECLGFGTKPKTKCTPRSPQHDEAEGKILLEIATVFRFLFSPAFFTRLIVSYESTSFMNYLIQVLILFSAFEKLDLKKHPKKRILKCQNLHFSSLEYIGKIFCVFIQCP